MSKIKSIKIDNVTYDISCEGSLTNSGFEVVTSLPTTNLFDGRQVMYGSKEYVYVSGQWKRLVDSSDLDGVVDEFNELTDDLISRYAALKRTVTSLTETISALQARIETLEANNCQVIDTIQDGFFVADTNYNVGMQVDDYGIKDINSETTTSTTSLE